MVKKISNVIIWSLLDTYAGFGLKFIFAIAIMRILTPRDYGIVAYMGLFLGIATWLSEGGFGTALIQKKNANDIDYSTAYFFNIGISMFFFILYFLIAPIVADYFNEKALTSVMRVTSLNLLLNSFCYIHLIRLSKALNFKSQALINFSSAVISGALGLTLALSGFKYWALIFQTLCGSLLRMIGLLFTEKWKPILIFNINSFKEQFRFGSKVFFSGLLDSIFNEIYSLIIGKTYKTQQLGLYSRGQKFFDIFIVQTGIAINKVLYPFLSSKKENLEINNVNYYKIYNLAFMIMAPLSLSLFFLSEPIIKVLLTEKWLGSLIYMKMYFIAGFVFMQIYFNSTTLLSINRPGLYLRMNLLLKSMLFIALMVTFNISIKAIVIGWLIIVYIHYFVYELIISKFGFSNANKYKMLLQVIPGLLVIALIHILVKSMISRDLILLIVEVIIFPISYFLYFKISRTEIYYVFVEIIGSQFPEKIRKFL